jgi:DNA polymerase I-like protein with 3'-5' exonuclease and polymerase domains
MTRYNEALKRAVRTDGFVKDPFGRAYFIEAKFAYKGLNYMVQGTAAGILKRAMLNADKWLKANCPQGKTLLTIHDELVFEIPNNRLNPGVILSIENAMTGDFHDLLGMPYPFKVESSLVKENWGKKEKWVLDYPIARDLLVPTMVPSVW